MSVRYSREHEWVKLDGDVATIGITDHAQHQLGDVVYVELPEVGREVTKGGDAAVVESVKAASEVFSPVTGEVVERNEDLEATPDKVNSDAEGAAWFFKVKLSDTGELDDLMDKDAYQAFLKTLD